MVFSLLLWQGNYLHLIDSYRSLSLTLQYADLHSDQQLLVDIRTVLYSERTAYNLLWQMGWNNKDYVILHHVSLVGGYTYDMTATLTLLHPFSF